MQNQQLSDVKGKELVAAGHAFANAIGMDTPLIEIAKMVSVLATRLDCALVRGDAHMQAEMAWEKSMMAAIGEDGVGSVGKAIAELKAQRDALASENAVLKSNLMFWDAEDPEAPYDHPEEIANNCAMELHTEFDVQVAAKMPNRTYRVSDVGDYDCTIELVCGGMPETPATDVYLNAVRAEGVEMVKSHPAISLCSLTHVCEEIAAQLRAGKDGE